MCRNLCRRLLASLPAKYLTAKYLNLLWQRQQHTFSFTFAGPLLFLAGIAGIFLCRAFININDVRRFCSLPAKYVCIFGQQGKMPLADYQLIEQGKEKKKTLPICWP